MRGERWRGGERIEREREGREREGGGRERGREREGGGGSIKYYLACQN